MKKTFLLALCIGDHKYENFFLQIKLSILAIILSLSVETSDAKKKVGRKGSGKGAENTKNKHTLRGGKKKKKGGRRRNPNWRAKKKPSRRNNNKKPKAKKKPCVRQSTTFCPSEKAQSLNLLYNKVTNFFKQLKRTQGWKTLIGRKKGKKDGFSNDATILTDAVGGDIANPSCASARSARFRYI